MLPALRLPAPLAIEKFTCTLLSGEPLLRTRALTGTLIVAPCETYKTGVDTPISEDDCVALKVPLTDLDGEYTPGASVAVIIATPAAAGVSHVATFPFWSVMTEHAAAPPQAESCTPFVPLQPTVAPETGVTPSSATTRTLMGFAACTPTGVEGFAPLSNTILSLPAAP